MKAQFQGQASQTADSFQLQSRKAVHGVFFHPLRHSIFHCCMRRKGIWINSIHPGYIWTPLVESMAKQSPKGAKVFRKLLDSFHSLGHVGEPNDVAFGILYLASYESKFVTGSELVIDGGYTARWSAGCAACPPECRRAGIDSFGQKQNRMS